MSDAEAMERLDELLSQAQKAGADEADALLVENHGLKATQRLGKLETVERSESTDLGLRVFIGKRQAIASTGDLGKASLEQLIETAVRIAKSVPEDPYAGLAGRDQIGHDIEALDLDDGIEPLGEELSTIAAIAEDSARSVTHVTNSEGATSGWSRSTTTLMATNGFSGRSTRSTHSIAVSVIASNGGPMSRDYDHATRIFAADLPKPADVGIAAAERAVRRINPKKVKSQAVPVIFDPRVSGGIVRHLASAIAGPAVARGTTFLKEKLDKPVFAKEITIIDDPLRAKGLRSRAFDAEGIASQRRTLVENGVLTSWLLDCASARQLGLETSGHALRGTSSAPLPAPSNIFMEPGALSPKDLIGTIADGFYVTEMLGMGVSYVTGDYSRGAAGFWIENGELGPPVAEVTIAGDLARMFLSVTAANDLDHRYGIDAPTLRIDGLTIAGQ